MAFTGVWITANLFSSSRLFKVSLPIYQCCGLDDSNSSWSTFLGTIPRVPITNGITVTNKFHIFFNSLARSKHLSHFPPSFPFTLWPLRTTKSTRWQFVLLIKNKSGFFLVISLYFEFSENLLCNSFYRQDSGFAFLSLVRFPVDHLPRPIMSVLLFLFY